MFTEGDHTVTHRVAFLDKPFTRPYDLTPKDRNQLFQKHAIRAVAWRPQQRGFPFVSTKPVHSVDKAPKLEDLMEEQELYETGLKEYLGAGFDKTANKNDSDDEGSPEKDKNMIVIGTRRNRGWKKDMKGKGKNQQSMFDLGIDDMDDLEKFGMDTNFTVKSPNSGDPGIKRKSIEEPGIHMEKNAMKSLKSPEKPALDELEKLKLELQQIKAMAKSDSQRKSLSERPSMPAAVSGENSVSGKDQLLNVQSENSVSKQVINIDTSHNLENKDSNNSEVAHETAVEETKQRMMDKMPSCEDAKSKQEQSENETKHTDQPEETLARKIPSRSRLSLTSLSAKIQQMSMIKSKLRQRSVDGKYETSIENQPGTDLAKLELKQVCEAELLAKKLHEKSSDNSVEKNNKSETEINQVSTESLTLNPFEDDSDDDSQCLVIDIPNDSSRASSPRKRTTTKSLSVASRSGPSETVDIRTRTVTTSEANKSDATTELEETEDQETESIESEQSVMKTRGAKRKSTTSVKKEVTTAKRTLRSSVSAGEIGLRSKTSKSDMEQNEEKADGISEEVIASPSRGRGRKRVLPEQRFVSILSKMLQCSLR